MQTVPNVLFARVSAFRFSYEALDPVLRRVLSDEGVLAGPLPQMVLERALSGL